MTDIVVFFLAAFFLGSVITHELKATEICSPYDTGISQVHAMQHLGVARGALVGLRPTPTHGTEKQERLLRSERCARLAIREWPPVVTEPLTIKLLHQQARLMTELRKARSRADAARGSAYIRHVEHTPWLFVVSLIICLLTGGVFVFLFVSWLIQFRRKS